MQSHLHVFGHYPTLLTGCTHVHNCVKMSSLGLVVSGVLEIAEMHSGLSLVISTNFVNGPVTTILEIWVNLWKNVIYNKMFVDSVSN